MTQLSLYTISVPVFVHHLNALSAIIDKAAAHATEKKIEPQVLIAERLYPDMLPFSAQIQIATDHAKGAGARLAGVDIPRYEDTEKTFDELKARLARTAGFLQALDKSAIDRAAGRDVNVQLRNRTLTLEASEYLLRWALPNFFFHCTTAYNLLRHDGVAIGKRDFMGGL